MPSFLTFYTKRGSHEIEVANVRPEDMDLSKITILATVDLTTTGGRHPDKRLTFERIGLLAFKAGMEAQAEQAAFIN